MPSTPLTWASIGAATVSCTVLELAPGYSAVTLTVGGVTSGYCATGNVHTATPPANVMTTEMTVAKIGRSMKKRENIKAIPTPKEFYNKAQGRDQRERTLGERLINFREPRRGST